MIVFMLKRTALLIIILLFSTQYDSFAQEKPVENTKVKIKKKRKKQMKTIALTPFNTQITIKVGEKLEYTYEDHASVGISSDYSIGNNKVVAFKEKNTVYDKPEPRPVGGDAAKTTFVFEAVASGTCQLTIQDFFRGDVKQEYKYTITVE